MSRFVRVATNLADREEALAGLRALGLEVASAAEGDALMLRGSLECAGEPVEIRLEAGALGSVEDFGLRRGEGGLELVCSEHDRAHLERALLGPLRREVAAARARAAVAAAGLAIEEERDVAGEVRLVVRRRS